MTEEERLIHLCMCVNEISDMREIILKKYGYTSTSFKREQDAIGGTVPDGGMEVDGHKVYPHHQNHYLIAGGKPYGKTTSLRSTKIKGEQYEPKQ